MRLDLLAVRRVVDDVAAAERFYGAGMPRVIELVPLDRFAELLGPHRRVDDLALVFVTDDVSAAVAELAERGATVVVEPRQEHVGISRFAQLRDPTGMLVELREPRVPDWGGSIDEWRV
jgi:hypothetical protein